MAAAQDGPLVRWQTLTADEKLQGDEDQRLILLQFQGLYERLSDGRSSWLKRLKRQRPSLAGIYLHGQVGRGKTMIMDLFAASLRSARVPVYRVHFHRFMDRTHQRLKALEGRRDPLQAMAADMAAQYRVLCFDEFQVSDIGDAMILGELLKALFARGLVVVATSNTEPDRLYAEGLQRARFLPAIEAIKQHCVVISLGSAQDYRLRELARHPSWLYPQTPASLGELDEAFRVLAGGDCISEAPLSVRGRQIQPRRRAGTVAWFDFDTLCRGHRASADYIELSRRFSTLIIQNVPALDDSDSNAVRRFIHLVDECYDRAVKLIIAAEVPLAELYRGQRLAAPFERTLSRLIEMQSLAYLALPHRP